MPISPKQQQEQPPEKSQPKPGAGQNTELPEKTPPPNQEPEPAKKEKKTPAQEKDDSLKYEMQYVNGGFNNG